MKNFDLAGCAHAWAHQQTERGQANNLFFEGATIYSYGRHFPIATLDGPRVFFTTQGYSRSTGKHKNIVHSAVSHKTILYVHAVPMQGDPRKDTLFQKANIDYWLKVLRIAMDQFAAHPRQKRLLTEINQTVQTIREFLDALELKPDKTLSAILDSPDVAGIQTLFIRQALQQKRQANRKANQAKKCYLAALQDWENHRQENMGYLPVPEAFRNMAWLRLKADQTRIETSKGVEIPLAIAERFYRYIRQVLPAGCTECGYSILDFTVEQIAPEGLVIGCHNIPMDQVDKIATQLHWK